MKKVGLSSILIAVVLLAVAVIAEAQQQTKVTKIGWLAASGRLPQFDDYKNALRALGYIEGKNIAFEYRVAGDEPGRFPALADELVRLKVDLIVANATTAALAAKNATRTIPIVFTSGGDPVAVGLIDSWRGLAGTSRASAISPRS
jgi:putative ABC transport system substrate-binding protein